jgi:hypothetical protein
VCNLKRSGAAIVYVTFAVIATPFNDAGATDLRGGNDVPIVIAQSAGATSVDKIRAQSQRMKEYRALLADPDADVRLAALDEMLRSGDAALRELAFEAGFASADQNMRALALRERVLSMKSFALELQNTGKLPDEAWQKASAGHRSALTFSVKKVEAQTGNMDITCSMWLCSGRVAGQELSFSTGQLIVRLRLIDGGVMSGTYSLNGRTIAATLTLH